MRNPRSILRGDDLQSEHTDQAGIDPGAVRVQVARILASSDFKAAERNRRFLSYIVEETLAGRGDRIKAYNVAMAVFGRDDSFDPQSDPIVRIEASRLRRSLEHYYLLAGKDDPVRIEIPKGGYVPSFDRLSDEKILLPCEPRPAAAPLPARWPRLERPSAGVLLLGVALLGAMALGWLASATGGLWPGESAPTSDGAMQVAALRQGPAILVAPFEDEGGVSAHRGLSGGFTREIIAGLTRFSDLFVFGPETAFRHGGAADLRGMAAELGVDFIVAGGVTVSDRFRVTASLIDANSGRYVWSGKFDGNLAAAEVIKIRDDLADQVVRELARPYGVIFNEQASEIQGKAPQSFTSYECVLSFYQYWRSYDADLYSPVRDCLERAIIADPDYADAFSSLALVYADAYRFNFGEETIPPDVLPRAMELARRAVDLAPDSSHSYQALHLVHWLMNDVEGSFGAAERGLALNPNDTELMADLGLRYSLRTLWDKGLPLVEQAFARNPAQPGQYRIAPFLHHYIHGRYQDALAEAKKIGVPGVIYNHIALAMAYAQVGRTEEADAEVDQILAIDPAYGDHVIADLQKRNVHPDLIRAVVDGLKKAGLEAGGSPKRGNS
jgi:TolB-like protein